MTNSSATACRSRTPSISGAKVGEIRQLSEDFQPIEVSEIAYPAEWQEQLTSAETHGEWDAEDE
jgi:hypothetical protein